MSKVLRAFDYSFDGITALKANVDDNIDFGTMTDGLVAAGYIDAVDPEPVQAQPEPVVVEPAPVEPVVVVETEPVVEEPVTKPVPVPEPTRKRK